MAAPFVADALPPEDDGVLFVRIRKAGPRETQVEFYSVLNPDGAVAVRFLYGKAGWYRVSETFGDILRDKRPHPTSPLAFDVYTLSEARSAEARDSEAERRRLRREELGELAGDDAIVVPEEHLSAATVPPVSDISDEEAERGGERTRSRRPPRTPRSERGTGKPDDSEWGDDGASAVDDGHTVDRTGEAAPKPAAPKRKKQRSGAGKKGRGGKR